MLPKMDPYYSDLATGALRTAEAALQAAREYSRDAGAPAYMEDRLKRLKSAVHNATEEIMDIRGSRAGEREG